MGAFRVVWPWTALSFSISRPLTCPKPDQGVGLQEARYEELGICGQGLISFGPQDVICRARWDWGSLLESRGPESAHVPHRPTKEARTTDDLSE